MGKYKIGDRIRFTTLTIHSGKVTATRKIISIDQLGIGVRMFGYNPYYLQRDLGDKIKKAK